MKESWRYYDYLRRWGLFLLLGLALGALAGYGYYLQQGQRGLFTATAAVSMPHGSFRVVSGENSDPNKAVEEILTNLKLLGDLTKNTIDVDVDNLSIEGRHPTLLWKLIVLSSIIGGLLAIGAAFVWDDAEASLRHRQQITSKDP